MRTLCHDSYRCVYNGVVNFLGVEVASRISPASTTFSVLIARDEAVKLAVTPEVVSAHADEIAGQ